MDGWDGSEAWNEMGWDRKGNGNEVGWVDPCVEKIQNI